jgi:putative peptide zinc metalloprotease protein
MDQRLTSDDATRTDVAPTNLHLTGTLFSLDEGAGNHKVVICKRGKYFQVGGFAADVARCIADGHRSIAAIEGQLPTPASHSPERVSEVVARLRAVALVSDEAPQNDDPAQPGAAATPGAASANASAATPGADAAKQSKPRSYMALKVPLLQAETLLPVTSRFARLLSPTVMLWVSPVLLIAQAIFCYLYVRDILAAVALLHGSQIPWLLFGNYLCLFLHEFGHAAACVRSGLRHGAIGFAIYLIFPAFYTDVSEAWRLPSRKRVIIDAAGIYVSVWISTIASIAYLLTGWPVVGILALLNNITVAVNMNPFIRMDAYWLLSDALRVPNLMAENKFFTKWLLWGLVGVRSPRPRILSLSPGLRRVYLVYYALFIVFVVFVATRFAMWYPTLMLSVPALAGNVVNTVHVYGFGGETVRWTATLVLTLIPAIGLSLYLGKTLLKAARAIRRTVWDPAKQQESVAP